MATTLAGVDTPSVSDPSPQAPELAVDASAPLSADTTDAPDPDVTDDQNTQFWNNLAESEEQDVSTFTDPEFPSVLLRIKRQQYIGSLTDVASLLMLEAEQFGPL